MIRQCAWCLEILGESPPYKDTNITHGICEKCSKELMKEVEEVEKMRKAS